LSITHSLTAFKKIIKIKKEKFMPNLTPEIEAFARIKVLGVGGSGQNAINHMIASKVRGVDFVAINTDAQDLHRSLTKKRINIGKNLTRGLGTGMNPDLGRRAAEETKEEIQEVVKGADMVFVTCGAGGGGVGAGGGGVGAGAGSGIGVDFFLDVITIIAMTIRRPRPRPILYPFLIGIFI
jgi:cell division protein FtsZ